MILVSTRFPEEIPSFKASRRAVVAAISEGGGGDAFRCMSQSSYLYDWEDPSVSNYNVSPSDDLCTVLADDLWLFGA